MKPEMLRILNVRSANRIHALPNIVTHRNNRECFGLMLKIEGETTYRTEDSTCYISDRTHFCLLPKGSSYDWQTTGGECYGIEFDADNTLDCPFVFSVQESEEPIHLFLQLEHALMNGDEIDQFRAISYLYRILLFLFEKPSHYSPRSKKDLIAPGVERMKTACADPDLTVADLAKESGISEVYFRKLYSEINGTSPVRALIAIRMKKAVELLQTDFNSVNAIATAVGYPNIYHFSKMFKQYFGVSPTHFLSSLATNTKK